MHLSFTVQAADISIHALREEGDNSRKSVSQLRSISIHALREEGDSCHRFCHGLFLLFLSTPSARRATILLCIG